jgi:hypothetical protein
MNTPSELRWILCFLLLRLSYIPSHSTCINSFFQCQHIPPLLEDLHFTSFRTPTLPPPIEQRLLPESETEIAQGSANSSSFHQPSRIPAEEKATPRDGIGIETAATKMTAQAPESSISQSENNNLSIEPAASSSGVSHSHIQAAIALLKAYRQGNLDLRDSVEGALRLIGKPTPQDKQSSP